METRANLSAAPLEFRDDERMPISHEAIYRARTSRRAAVCDEDIAIAFAMVERSASPCVLFSR